MSKKTFNAWTNSMPTTRVPMLTALAVAGALAFGLGASRAHAATTANLSAPGVDAAQAQALRQPQVQQKGDVAYVNGGVGSVNRAHTMALGHGMDLQLVFAQMPHGAYVANVDVKISKPDGQTVLELPSASPLLYAQLPPGRYQVSATVNGRTIERNVQVPTQGQHTEWFHWRSPTLASSGSRTG